MFSMLELATDSRMTMGAINNNGLGICPLAPLSSASSTRALSRRSPKSILETGTLGGRGASWWGYVGSNDICGSIYQFF